MLKRNPMLSLFTCLGLFGSFIDDPNNNGGSSNNDPKEPEVKKVEMTQDELNTLINKKYASGAEKAKAELLTELGVENADILKQLLADKKAQDEANKTELEKLQEQLNALTSERDKLANNLTETQKKAKLNELALKNGIDDVEYFEYRYNKSSSLEGFDEAKFLEEFATKKAPPKTDSSSNNNDVPTRQTIAEQAKLLAQQGKYSEAQKLLNQL